MRLGSEAIRMLATWKFRRLPDMLPGRVAEPKAAEAINREIANPVHDQVVIAG
jgi:hypothetical protein